VSIQLKTLSLAWFSIMLSLISSTTGQGRQSGEQYTGDRSLNANREMRVLIDTNVLIHREDDKTVPRDLQRLLETLNRLRISVLVHPASLQDLRRDTKLVRSNVLQSKFRSYEQLSRPPDYRTNRAFVDLVGMPTKSNDDVDNALLYAVFQNAVDFLITEDRGILRKAAKLSTRDRVIPIDEALVLFSGILPRKAKTSVPLIQHVPVNNLDINDSFFDDLKEDYPEFLAWFTRVAKAGRECLVFWRDDGSIGALLIYKIEEADELVDCTPELPRMRRVKLSTFKVTETGNKVGELFIKMAVEFARENDIGRIYLTHIVKSLDDKLVRLLLEYGFIKVGNSSRQDENVFEKAIRDPIRWDDTTILSPRMLWPMFRDEKRISKFMVPIWPEYHDRLFIEFEGRLPTLFDSLGFVLEGNTIGKAYLCHSRIKKISTGDLLLFYRSKDLHAITTLGVVEEAHANMRDAATVQELVDRRTVYSRAEIEETAKRDTLVLLFTWNCYLDRVVSLDQLRKFGISDRQSVSEISHEQYIKIISAGGISGHLVIH